MVIWDYFKQFGDENVAATVLVDQGPSDFKWPDWPLGLFDLPSLIHLMSEVQTGCEKVFRDFIPLLFREPPTAEDLEWMVADRADVSKVSVPSLVISGGAENKLVPIEAVRFVHENIPGSRFSLYERSNHCPFLEESERFNREVEAFVRSLD